MAWDKFVEDALSNTPTDTQPDRRRALAGLRGLQLQSPSP